jgi:hypothetical protein
MRFDVAPVGIGRLVCERFHVMPGLLLVLPIAAALDRVRFPELPAVALVVVLGAAAMPGHRANASPAVEDDVVNLLRSVPEHAIVIHADDEWYFGSIYAQQLLGIRPDVTLVQWGMADFAWYRTRTGLDLSLPGDGSGMRGIVARLVAGDRPVFVQPAFTAIADAFPRYPHGVLFRLLPPGAPEPSLDEVVALNTRLFAAFELAPKTDGAYAVVIRTRYAETWKRIAGALEAEGRDATFARDKARELQ